MNTPARFRLPAARCLALSALCLLPATSCLPAARANVYSWKGGGGDAYWSNPANWQGGIAPPVNAPSTDLIFDGAATGATSLQTAYSILSLTFNAGATAYDFTGSSLTLREGGLTQKATNTETFTAGVILGSGQTWTLAAGTGILAFNGGLNTNGQSLTINAATATGNGNVVQGVFSGAGALTKTGAGTLTLTGANTYSGGTTLAAGSLGVDNNTALGTGTLTVSADASIQAVRVDHALANPIAIAVGTTLTVSANAVRAQNLSLNGAISEAGGRGSGNVTVNAAGTTVTLGGTVANSYTGQTLVTAGTLALGKSNNVAALAGGALLVGNAGANPAANTPAVATVRLNADGQLGLALDNSVPKVTISGDGLFDLNDHQALSGALTLGGGEVRFGSGTLLLLDNVSVNASTAGARFTSTSFSNNANLAGSAVTFTVADGAARYDLDVQAGVTNGTLIKSGLGTLRLAGHTNTSLAVTLNAGTLAAAGNAALGSGTFTLAGGTVVADGANVSLANAVTLTGNAALGASVDGTPHTLSFAGPLTLTTSATLTADNPAGTTFNGAAGLGANTLTVTGAGSLSLNGPVSGTGGVVKSGTGTLTLGNAANTLTGGLTLNGGTLAAAADGSLGGPANVLTLNVGTLAFTGSTSTARTFNLNNAITLALIAGGTLTYTSGASVNGGNLGGGGTHAFADGSALSGTTALIGSTLTQSGTAAFNNVTVRGTFTQVASATLNATNGLNVAGSGTVTAAGTVNLVNGGESLGRIVINPGATVNVQGNALYLDGGSRTTINSGGTLSTAAGTSIELNGGLLVNNGTQSGVLNVNFGGLAKGAGSFGTVNVTGGGRFSPGNSPGSATAASFTFGAAGRYDFELNAATGTPGVNSDLLTVTNTLAITAGTTANSVFTVGIFSLNSANQSAPLADFDPSQPYRFLLVDAAAITGFSADRFAVDTGGFGNSLMGGSFSVVQDAANGDLFLQFSPVPEPATWPMVAGGLLTLVGIQRAARRRIAWPA